MAALRRQGLRVRYGPVLTVDRIVGGADEREQLLADTGALAVDMEGEPLVRGFDGRPVAVVRVVVDTPCAPLPRFATARNGAKALSVLRRIGPALSQWAALAGSRSVVLAGPRSFCAGVERAIDIVDLALQRYQHPVYVRRQIVHNAHVVRDLEHRGAVFVDELHEVPDGATVVFSAHGVAPAVREEAESRELNVIDATCPLVAKVHAEARRFAARGDTVLLIGHEGHDETEGTLGEIPGRIHLVQTPEEAERMPVANPDQVSYLMQTTLALEEAEQTVDVLRRRFPRVASSASDDICYATTNRQRAIRAVAAESEVVLVVGSSNSSNSLRLVEVAERAGATAHLLDDATELQPEWLTGVSRVGITAGASAPPHLVDEVIGTLRAFGVVEVTEQVHAREEITFTLPKGVAG